VRSSVRALYGGLVFLSASCVSEAAEADGFCVPITAVYSPYDGPRRGADPLDCPRLCGPPPWDGSVLGVCEVVDGGQLGGRSAAPGAMTRRKSGPLDVERGDVAKPSRGSEYALACFWGTQC
jgi:hypothetical protein